MPVMPDHWIVETAERDRMIDPFERGQVRSGISYGTSSYGYDFRLADEFKLLDLSTLTEIDPKKANESQFQSMQSDSILIPPGQYALGRSVEYFRIPRSILTFCSGKSTYARSGLIVNVTPFEPEWEGYATLALANCSPLPVRVYANEGIAQLIFLKADSLCRTSYADKQGKYQAQQSITVSKLDSSGS